MGKLQFAKPDRKWSHSTHNKTRLIYQKPLQIFKNLLPVFIEILPGLKKNAFWPREKINLIKKPVIPILYNVLSHSELIVFFF